MGKKEQGKGQVKRTAEIRKEKITSCNPNRRAMDKN